MNEPRSRHRPPPLLKGAAWFLPGWIAVAIAALGAHPLALIPLLAANALTMAAVCHAIGFDPLCDHETGKQRQGECRNGGDLAGHEFLQAPTISRAD